MALNVDAIKARLASFDKKDKKTPLSKTEGFSFILRDVYQRVSRLKLLVESCSICVMILQT